MIVHDQPFDEYLAAEGMGSSEARLATVSVQLLRDYQTGIYRVGDKSHHQIGRLCHLMVLEPLKFAQAVVSQGPYNEKTLKPYGRDTNAFREWQAQNPGKLVVEPWIMTMLDRMPDEVRRIFSGGSSEVSVYQTLPVSGLKVKCRDDYLRDRSITDFKTCDDVDRAEREITKWKYWFQFGWYRMVMKAVTGEDHAFQFVFAEKNPPYRWRIVPMAVDYQMWADAQVDETLAKILDARDSGNWKDRGEVEQMASLPDFLNDDEPTDEEE